MELSHSTVRDPSRDRPFVALVVPLAFYLALIPVVGYLYREQMTIDGLFYIRNAMYLAEGRVLDSVSGYWSPLLSWSVAPLVAVGVDGLYAARVVLAVWGAAVIAASFFFIRRCTKLTAPWDMLALILIAGCMLRWTTFQTTPDVLLGACLIAYCALVGSRSRELLRRRSWQVGGGLLGGAAYLAKSYGLPFFLAHYTFTVALLFWMERKAVSWRQAGKAWLLGVVGFAAIAGPWIGLLSWKHGRFTFSTSGAINHAIVGPPDKPRWHYTGLRVPPPGRFTHGEIVDAYPYNHWSPFESWRYFRHQIKNMLRSAGAMVMDLRGFDRLGICLPALVLIPLAFLATRRGDGLQILWTWGTIVIYCGGFFLVFYTPRYVISFLWPICAAFALDMMVQAYRYVSSGPSPGSSRLLRWCLHGAAAAVILYSFSFPFHERSLWERRFTGPIDYNGATGPWRLAARELRQDGCKGPVASTPGCYSAGMYIAWHMPEVYLGEALGKTVAEIEQMLKDFGVKTFVLAYNRELSKAFVEETRWRLQRTYPGPTGKIYVFVPPA